MKCIRSSFVITLCIYVFQNTALAKEKTTDPVVQLPEVVVSSKSVDNDSSEMDTKTERLFRVPGAGLDPLNAVKVLPGVTTASDYSNAPAVRGSAPDDNAYYIDFIPARYLFHDFGNSIFNENLIRSFDLYPAAFGSQYNNATGAVIDVKLRDPRNQPFTTTLDWSFLRTGILFETAINKNQAFYASYRRSLIDKFADKTTIVGKDSGIEVNKLPIADDYQFKYSWQLGGENQLIAVAAGASDSVAATFTKNSNEAMRDPDFAGPASRSRGFDSQGIMWNYLPRDGANSLTALLTHTAEESSVRYGTGQFFSVDTNRELLRSHYGRRLTDAHWLNIGLGIENTKHKAKARAKIVSCTSFDPDCPTLDAPLYQFQQPLNLGTINAYAEDEWQTTKNLLFTSGINYTTDDYLNQQAWQPRFRLNYVVDDFWAINAAIGRYAQLPQLQEMMNIIGNPKLHYINANHYVLGLENKLSQDWSWTLDAYYKDLKNVVIGIKDNSRGDFANNYSNDASGRAYGIEFLLNKKLTQKWDGWLAVSLSKTERQDERTGEKRPFDYDRPVMINWVANYRYNQNWSFGLKWSLRSGGLYTPIVGTRTSTNNPAVTEPVYGELNSERLPIYHRLDLRAEYITPVRIGYLSLFADILNAYGQHNIEGYTFSPNGNNLESPAPNGFGDNVPVSANKGFPFFPSIGFKIQF